MQIEKHASKLLGNNMPDIVNISGGTTSERPDSNPVTAAKSPAVKETIKVIAAAAMANRFVINVRNQAKIPENAVIIIPANHGIPARTANAISFYSLRCSVP